MKFHSDLPHVKQYILARFQVKWRLGEEETEGQRHSIQPGTQPVMSSNLWPMASRVLMKAPYHKAN